MLLFCVKKHNFVIKVHALQHSILQIQSILFHFSFVLFLEQKKIYLEILWRVRFGLPLYAVFIIFIFILIYSIHYTCFLVFFPYVFRAYHDRSYKEAIFFCTKRDKNILLNLFFFCLYSYMNEQILNY